METDGVDSDDDNDVLKSDQVCLPITDVFLMHCFNFAAKLIPMETVFSVLNIVVLHSMDSLCTDTKPHSES